MGYSILRMRYQFEIYYTSHKNIMIMGGNWVCHKANNTNLHLQVILKLFLFFIKGTILNPKNGFNFFY